MDLAGLAALLGVPVAIFAALWAPRDRALVARLERIEKQLAEGSTTGQPRQMLESARDHLAERIAIVELRPQYRKGWVLVLTSGGLGAVLLLVLNLPSLEQPEHRDVFLWAAWLLYTGGVTGGGIVLGKQQAWLTENRAHAYSRADKPFM